MEQEAALLQLWSREREACDELTRDMMKFAALRFGERLEEAWKDFEMCDFPEPLEEHEEERQIFMPYFLFHWDPFRPRSGKATQRYSGVVARAYALERGNQLSDLERLFLDQSAKKPVSFYEVLWNKPGERMELRDMLVGGDAEVFERSGSRGLRLGDILFAQVWNLTGYSILGCTAPICIPPKWKSEIIGLRRKLQKKIAKQNRNLAAEDLVRYAEDIREAYLDIRDRLNAPPRFANTDGDPLHFHTLTFSIESAEAAFEALAPLAAGRSKEELLEGAEYDEAGKLRSLEFDWLKKGNRKMSTWENTILGSIKISEHSLIAEVNSEKRAERIRAEIEKRLRGTATHQSTVAKTADEMLAESPQRGKNKAKIKEEAAEDILRDPEVRKKFQEKIQEQVDAWANEKVPALGGRTPMQAVKDPDGREIVESLLVQWERNAEEGLNSQGMRPDIGRLRKILNLPVPEPEAFVEERMGKRSESPADWIGKRAKQGYQGYPIATISLYGPTAEFATKIVVAIFRDERQIAEPFERWFSEGVDVRENSEVGEKVVALLEKHGVKSVVMTDRIMGCPHEEGIDYPEGKSCPKCPYWAGRDRFTHERIQ
jgi:hypothetical protein